MVAAEAAVDRGVVPASPMVLVSDPAVADPSRAVAGHRPVWSYAHVPRDSEVDPTDLVIAQIERFAPGFRDTIVASQAIPASQMSAHNANYVGGDIAAGGCHDVADYCSPFLVAGSVFVGGGKNVVMFVLDPAGPRRARAGRMVCGAAGSCPGFRGDDASFAGPVTLMI